MMTAKHTPGPWKCDQNPIFGEWFVRQDPKDWNGMGYQLICTLPATKKGTHFGDMFRANAELIASAPMLRSQVDALAAALRNVQTILFPDPAPAKEGSQLIMSLDAYDNLDGARLDLERLGCDRVCLDTIERVLEQLAQARAALSKADR